MRRTQYHVCKLLLKRRYSEIVITDSAAKRLKKIATARGKTSHLRVAVDTGGCGGFSYNLSIEDEIEKHDVVVEHLDSKVLVDAVSLMYIKGSTVDWIEELGRSAFEVKNNPNAEQSCGCGVSFSPKEDV